MTAMGGGGGDEASEAFVREATRSRDEARSRLLALVGITKAFAESTGDYASLLQEIVERTGQFLDGLCILGVVTDDGRWWEPAAEYVGDPDLRRDLGGLLGRIRREIVPGPMPSINAILTGKPVVLDDAAARSLNQRVPPDLAAVLARYDVGPSAAVPMRSKGRTVGTLSITRWGKSRRELEPDDVDLLQVIADHAAHAIVAARNLDAVTRELAEHKRTRESLERAEERLRQAAKMEAVGRLAGGVAHDFNNILTVVLSYSEMLLHRVTESDPERADLLEIRRAGERAAELTKQLLAFSRKQIILPRVVSLNTVLTGVAPMLKRTLGEDVELNLLQHPELWLSKVDPGQVEQVLMNLIVNARDAMPNGGTITIETLNAHLDEAYAAEHPEASVGDHVCIVVADTGHGMDRDTVRRMFEPFFTTKGVGTGTGLGLATVYGIVHQSGGCIWVYSEVGRGTTFKVYFPRVHGVVTEEPMAPSTRSPPRGTETILLVEDEAPVRNLVRGVLSRAGYHVLVASNGGEALLICEQHEATIHLLVTDVVMPRMSGRRLAERLLGLRKALKVLYMSGYTENTVVHHGILDSGIQFLAKPITPDALLQKVREVLDATPASH
jgi:signal transduction histidine kinase/ActR/RegA family two-component response regulator